MAISKQRIKPNYRHRLLRLPNLDHCKRAVLNSLGSPAWRRVYEYAIDQFIAWYRSEPRLAFHRMVVVRYRMHLESRGLSANTINQQLAAVRRLAHEAADAGLLSPANDSVPNKTATLLTEAGTAGGSMTQSKGRLNFSESSSASIAAHHIIRLIDSQPDLTRATTRRAARLLKVALM